MSNGWSRGEGRFATVTDQFCFGILAGFAIAGVVALLLQQYLWATNHIGGFFHPQVVVHPTAQTPAQVFQGCLAGVVGLLVLLLVIAVVAFLVWYLG